jgi:hypothetical protein
MVIYLIMSVSGLLAVIGIFAEKWSDFGITINDMYMIILMNTWMLFFMAILDKNITTIIVTSIIIISTYYSVRTQMFINRDQYYKGMITHHSMAVLMSKKLLDKKGLNEEDKKFLQNLIKNQEAEIEWMKTKIDKQKKPEWKMTTKL